MDALQRIHSTIHGAERPVEHYVTLYPAVERKKILVRWLDRDERRVEKIVDDVVHAV